MLPPPEATAPAAHQTVNWIVGNNPDCLEKIHQPQTNIAIYERSVESLATEIDSLLHEPFEFGRSGQPNTILDELAQVLAPDSFRHLLRDIEAQLTWFEAITQAKKFRLMLATINDNMCRKFHTDINDLRLLCTYSGPGTLWLPDDNVNHAAFNDLDSKNEHIVIDESRIQQAPAGAVVLLKGAIYPQENVQAAVHRSPTIEESGDRRLLLRIDTNEFLNIWS